MNCRINITRTIVHVAVISSLGLTAAATAEVTITGLAVPELASFDTAMSDFMDTKGIEGGVLAVSKDGCVVYQRGFTNGSDPRLGSIKENTPFRIASIEKPLTASVIQALVSAPNVDLALDDYVFDLGQPEGGILNIDPYNDTLGDSRMEDITVQHLLDHQGGWYRDVSGDLMFQDLTISSDLGIYPTLPTRVQVASWALAQPLDYTPGSGCGGPPNIGNCGNDNYSNFGYMLLGLIIQEKTGLSPVDAIKARTLTAEMWIPSSELFRGRSLEINHDPREPFYNSNFSTQNLFDPDGANVTWPYGGWHLENMQGHGNIVASAAPILRFLDTYHIWYFYGGNSTNVAGTPISSFSGGAAHSGSLDGTSTTAWQHYNDGLSIAVLFNRRDDAGPSFDDWAAELRGDITDIINDTNDPITWPTLCVDGYWLDPSAPEAGDGAYDTPFDTLSAALSSTDPGSKIHMEPGALGWTGTISEKTRLDAPFGVVRIGDSN